MITEGTRVLIPRSNGTTSPGAVMRIYRVTAADAHDDDLMVVKLDELGSRGQELGKHVYRKELMLDITPSELRTMPKGRMSPTHPPCPCGDCN